MKKARVFLISSMIIFGTLGLFVRHVPLSSGELALCRAVLAAILIGGATPKKASVFNVVLGVILFQCLLTLATPVANAVINAGSISEVVRIIVQNGIILYALTKIRANGGK